MIKVDNKITYAYTNDIPVYTNTLYAEFMIIILHVENARERPLIT